MRIHNVLDLARHTDSSRIRKLNEEQERRASRRIIAEIGAEPTIPAVFTGS